jgi:hypothetical protein
MAAAHSLASSPSDDFEDGGDEQPSKKQGVTPDKFLTTEEVLVTLGISSATLQHRIVAGFLRPIKKKAGSNKNFYNPEEVEAERKRVANIHAQSSLLRKGLPNRSNEKIVEKLQKKAAAKSLANPSPDSSNDSPIVAPGLPNEGEIASKAFELFEKNTTVRAAIIELKQSVSVVKNLYQEWKNLGPEWLVSETDVKTLRSMLKWNEDPPTFQGFLRAFNDMIVKRAEDIAHERAEEIARDMMKNLVRQPVPAASAAPETPVSADLENSVSQAEREALEKIDD